MGLASTRSRGTLREPWSALVLAVALTTAPLRPAQAATHAPSESEVERARELYENGRRLFEEGSYEGAILAFERAYELSGEANLLYNIALAYDRLEQFDQAIEYLDRYRGLAPASERDELRRRRDSLQKRLDKQREREAEASETSPDERETVDPEPPPPEPVGPEPDAPPPPPRTRIYGPVAWGLTATAAVGLGLGIGFGVASVTRGNETQDACLDGLCQSSARSDVKASVRHAIVADVGFAVGAAAAIGVIVVVAVKAAKARKDPTANAHAPRFELARSGLVLRF